MIDFSQLGFIGKMFQSDQLNLAKILSILLLACLFFKPTVFTQLFERTMIAGLEIMGIFFMCFLCHIVYKWICESSVSGLKMLRNASSIMGI